MQSIPDTPIAPPRTRRTAEDSKRFILACALRLANSVGIKNYSSTELAAECVLTHSNIFYHFSNMDYLREEVMRLAIETANVGVIAQGLAMKCPIANTAPDKLKRKALSSLNN